MTVPAVPADSLAPSTGRLALITLLAALALLAWDASPGDLWLASLAGSPAGFAWREHWWLAGVMHNGGRWLAYSLIAALVLLALLPRGPWRALSPAQRWQLAGSALLGVSLISLLKSVSHTSCPWDLQAFGGVARHVSHWAWGAAPDGGGGRCFPAGHASSGFAFIGGWFVFRASAPRLARAWLWGTLAFGLALGIGQQLRGAHFMSHTLWTAWVCWTAAWGLDVLLRRQATRAAGRALRTPVGAPRPPATPVPWRQGPALVLLATSAWLAALPNAALWRALAELGLLQGAKGWAFALAVALIVWAATALLATLLAWRWTLKPALSLLLLAAAAGAHFMLSYNVVIDSTMITNVLQTDVKEAGDLLSLRFLGTLLVLGVLPVLWLWRRPVVYGRWTQRLAGNTALLLGALALLVATVLASFQPLSATMRNHKQLRYLINPLNSVYALGDLAATPFKRNTRLRLPIGQDAQVVAAPGATRPPLLLLVLGETARAANFSLNGYNRPTTPELAQLPVISWRNAWSCGTSTAASVPCMFSHLGREGFSARKTEFDTVLDVAQRAGLAVLWIDNQSGCKGVCDRVPNVSTATLKDPELCASGECWDGILLKGLDERVAALPAAARAKGVLLVMHQMGSHGPAYSKRMPPAFKRFTPECTTPVLQDCSREQVLNAYDNTIAYTDHVLAQAIGWLGRQQATYDPVMVYMSDHGESLGENNLYLHGLPYALAPEFQKRVPWITWLSPGLAQAQRLSADCLKGRADAEVSHDHLFHSVLGLLQVRSSVYQPQLDAYAPCRAQP